MPRHIIPHAIRLEFAGEQLVHANLSGAAFIGEELWVAGDEACGLDRLSKLPPVGDEQRRFGQARHFPLAEVLDLPDAAEIEADIEGLDYHGGYLWLVGSHGLKRKAPKSDRSSEENLKRLATVSHDGNRCLLARVAVQATPEGHTLVKHNDAGLSSKRLRGNTLGNDLTELLAKDRHYQAYLAIPGKDNGFDIEGIAVDDTRILLGLRGPVLRGYSGLLEVQIKEKGDELRLDKIADSGKKLRKHFIRLAGLGVRDLHWHGDDLFILAGPTMALDGAIRLFKWRNAAQALAAVDPAVDEVLWESNGPTEELSLPYGIGQDRAEAITCLPTSLSKTPQWLTLYDAPSPKRLPEEQVVLGDLLARK
jgi:hypothetical protein